MANCSMIYEDDFIIRNNMLISYIGDGDSEVVLPDNILYILHDAFKNNNKIEIVVIPDTVSSIEKGAFRNCKNLKEIYYSTKDKDITIGCPLYTNRMAG